MNKKQARPAFAPPSIPPKPLTEDQVRALALARLADPNYTPGQVLSTESGQTESATPAEQTPFAAVEAPVSTEILQEAPGEAFKEPEVERVTEPVKTPTAPGKGYPWAKADPRVKVIFSMRLPEELHMKLTYLLERSTSKSIHAICLDSVERTVAKMLKDLEK